MLLNSSRDPPRKPEYYNPAEFCLPFYRSFLAVTFPEVGSQEQVNRYLAEAKAAVEDSKSRELLLEAVENLSLGAARGPPASGRQEVASRPGGLSAILRTVRQSCWTRRMRHGSGGKQAPPQRTAHLQPANKSDS